MCSYLENILERQDLTSQEESDAVAHSFGPDATDADIAGFSAYSTAETSAEITGVVSCLRRQKVPVTIDTSVLYFVGTTIEGENTINIFTAASAVAAVAGCRVGQPGIQSVSSRSGIADVLDSLGIEHNLTPYGVAQCMNDAGIRFMFALTHHPSLKRTGPIRKSLKISTVFIIVELLLNPCSSEYVVIGVFKLELLDTAADVLIAPGVKKGVSCILMVSMSIVTQASHRW